MATESEAEMYVHEEPNGFVSLRQTRFRDALKAGREHPHDVRAMATDRPGLASLCKPHWPDVDYGIESRWFLARVRQQGALGSFERKRFQLTVTVTGSHHALMAEAIRLINGQGYEVDHIISQ